MKERTIKEQIGIFCVLMFVLIVSYVILNRIIVDRVEERKHQQELERVYTSHWEYVKTKDCAPIIDEYGLNQVYVVEFDIKTSEPTSVMVNFQNGYGAKYEFTEWVETSCEYQHFTFYITPSVWMMTETEACLAFSAPYGTGIIPTVTNVWFELYTEGEE